MAPRIEQVIDAIPDWNEREVTFTRIQAGLTNTNYRVLVDGVPHFVRIPGAATELLAVDRGNEIHNTRAAAQSGVSPLVLQTVPDWDVFVLEWLDAETMSIEKLGAPGMPGRIAQTLRRLHAGPAFRDDFDMFRLSERYLALVDKRTIPIPAGYRERMDRIPRIEAALARHPLAPVPCHNDLLAANFIGDGERLWIVDWEYAGMGDPAFDLANFAVNNGLDEEADGVLLETYGGDPDAHVLMRFMSDFREAMWGVVQQAVSDLDFDFGAYAARHFERLERTAAERRFRAALR